MMKKTVILILLAVFLVPVLIMSCSKTNTTATTPVKETKTIDISIDEFSAQNHITRSVELTNPGSLTVTLGSNPTTGYQWGENPILTTAGKDPILSQLSHEFVAPKSDGEVAAGAPGKEVWVFDSLKTGSSAISFSYGRQWEGGEKDTWTLAINVTVK
jgi:inhibitor of cysteine peptidase